MKLVITLASFLLLAACGPVAIKQLPSDNSDLKVELIGHADGCTIYRFADDKYFVRCGQDTTTSWQESCGENCVHEVEVQDIHK